MTISRSFFPVPPLLVLLIGLGSVQGGRDDLSDQHRRWLQEEAVYIISSQERREFLALETDPARDEFIRRFWELRDPDGSTEINEFQQEHYRRIHEANQRFHDGKPGWKTDRGRIFIMHGPPDDVSYTFGGDALPIDIVNPTEVLVGSGIQDRRRLYRVETTRPETEIWLYRYLPGARHVAGYFEVIFSRVNPTELIQLHQTIRSLGIGPSSAYAARVARDSAILHFLSSRQVMGPYRILYAGEYKFHDIDSFYQSIFHPGRGISFSVSDLQLGLGDLERSPGDVLWEKLRRAHRLKEEVETRVSFETFDIDLRFGSMRAESGGTLLPVILGIGREHRGENVDLLVELVRPDGTTAASLADYFKVAGAPESAQGPLKEPFVYQTRLAARPGRYSLRVYAYLTESRRAHFSDHAVALPDYRERDMSMSDVMLFDRVISRKGSRKHQARFLAGSSPLLLKDHALVPATDADFRRRENLTAIFEVYNPGFDSEKKEPTLNLTCRLWEGSQMVAALPGRILDYFTDSSVAEGVRKTTYGLTLPLRSLRPGSYSLELEVHDAVLNRTVSRRTDFRVY